MYKSGACNSPPFSLAASTAIAPAAPRGAKIGAFQRVYRNIDFRKQRLGRVRGQPHFFPDIEHGRFVAFALADDDGAVHLHRVHGLAHGFHRNLVGLVAVAKSHGARGGDSSVLHHAQKFQAELLFHSSLRRRFL
jgi:hypothetical protein